MREHYYEPLQSDFARRRARFVSGALGESARLRRLSIVSAICFIWAVGIIFRLVSLQIADFERWQEWALKEHFKEIVVASERGPILDRNGRLLAVSVPAGSVYVRPRQVKNRAQAISELSDKLKIPAAQLESKFRSSEPFVWIERQLPRAKAEEIAALNLPGIGYIMEARRYYPYNEAASSLIGMVGVDGNGLSGLEARYEKRLHTDHLRTRVTRDAYGNIIQADLASAERFKLPKGSSLQLTLDSAMQQIVDEELEMGRRSANAKAALAVMIDAETGEILAMSQAPAYNFNVGSPNGSALRNMVLESVFEPGSVMKPIVAAAAIHHGVLKPQDLIDCEGGRTRVGPHTIKDVHPYGILSAYDIVVRSSNIGMTKIGMRLGSDKLYEYLRAFGFGDSSGLGLAGETSGILRPVSEWARVDVATHSFGQGIAVTPLQMVRAVSALANGGKLPTLRIIDDEREFELKRVISEKAAMQGRAMLYGVVEDEHGTGKLARIEGVRVGGKTGTAQKARRDGRGYEPGAYIASFVGFVDGAALGVNRTLSLMVAIDEPNTTSIYGGTLAAPVFRRIVQRTLHMLSTQSEIRSSVEPVGLRQRYSGPESDKL